MAGDGKLSKDEFTTPLDQARMTERDGNAIFEIVSRLGGTPDTNHVVRADLVALFNRWDIGMLRDVVKVKVKRS